MTAIASATRRRPIAAIAVMLVLAVDSSCHGSTAPTGVGGRSFNHIVMVVEENTDYTSVIGSSSMPYLNGLAQQYGLATQRSEEHTSELQSRLHLVCRLLLEK